MIHNPTPEQFRAEASKLWEFINGKSGRVFFVNDHLGQRIHCNNARIKLEIDGSTDCPGDIVTLEPDDIESMGFNSDDYQYQIVTKEESDFDGQGYDIEAYDLERIEFPS